MWGWGALAAAAVSGIGQWWANRKNQTNAGNRWQTAVKDMRRAGLNPALAYSQGPAAMPQVGNIGGAAVEGFRGGASAFAQGAATKADIAQKGASAQLLEQQAQTEVQKTKQAEVESNTSKLNFNWMDKSFGARLNEVGARVESLSKQAGYSSAAAVSEGRRAENIATDTALKQAQKDLVGANRELAGYEINKQKGFEQLFGQEGWKRYIGSMMGGAIGGGAQAFRNVMSPFQ